MVDASPRLNEISEKIRKKNESLLKARKSRVKFEKKKREFDEIFWEKKPTYLVYGIACIVVLIFDFIVSHQTLQYLARILRFPPASMALIFTILDAALAVLASGGLASNDSYKRKYYRMIFRPILILLGTLKLVLFGFFVYDSYLIIDAFGNKVFPLSTWEFLRVILPQIIFILIVYSVLTFAGLGLFYVFGELFFLIWKFTLDNPDEIEKQIRELFDDFRTISPNSFESNLLSYGLKDIYDDVSQTNPVKINFEEKKYEQN
ncbi:MAG: hypothetical protein ACK4SO_05025 [Candidatus Kapaibacteriota bacterium]